MKHIIIAVTLAATLLGCSEGTENDKPTRRFPDPHIKTEKIISMTIIRLDSNETQYAITNLQQIAKFNDLIQSSLSTLQEDPFPESIPSEVLEFDIKTSNADRHLYISLFKKNDEDNLYGDISGQLLGRFKMSRGKEMIQLLEEVGYPINDFAMPTKGYIPKSVEEVEASMQE